MSFLDFSDPHVLLTWLLSPVIFLPAIGALILCVIPRGTDEAIRRFSLIVTLAVFVLTIWLAVPTGSRRPAVGRFVMDTPACRTWSATPGFPPSASIISSASTALTCRWCC